MDLRYMFTKILSMRLLPNRLIRRRGLWRDERGATAVITAITFMLLMGFTALGVEVGSWYAERRALQTAADAAALGAGYKIYKDGHDAAGIADSGVADASRNGFTNGAEGVTLTVTNPPATGPNAANEYAAEAVISKQRTALLASMFMSGDDLTIRTRAVAVVRVGGPFCVLALDPSAGSALKFGGTSELQLQNCGIIVNSESNSAMNLIGGSVVGATYADITGNYTKSTNSTLEIEEGQPNIGVDPLADPFEDINIPADSGCGFGTPPKYQINNNGTETLNPGRYCGGIQIGAGAQVTMNPGEYVMDGGVFNVAGGASVTGVGVTIFLTGSGTDYAQVTINGGGTINISAPTSGTYKGIVFFQDRNAPVAATGAQNKFNGDSNTDIRGVIYIPKQKTEWAGGNSSGPGCTKIVALKIEFTGNSSVGSDCTAFGFDDETRRPPKLME
jgi:hypothetical protein